MNKVAFYVVLIFVFGLAVVYLYAIKIDVYKYKDSDTKIDSLKLANEKLQDSIKTIQLQSNQFEHYIFDLEKSIEKEKSKIKEIDERYKKLAGSINYLNTDEQIELLSNNLSKKDNN